MEGPAVARVRPSTCASRPDEGPRRGVSQHTPIAYAPNLARIPRALASAISENSARRAVCLVPRSCRASHGARGAQPRLAHVAGLPRRCRDRSARDAPRDHRASTRRAAATDLRRTRDTTGCAARTAVRSPRATLCARRIACAPPPVAVTRRELKRLARSRASVAPAQATARPASQPRPRREAADSRRGLSTESWRPPLAPHDRLLEQRIEDASAHAARRRRLGPRAAHRASDQGHDTHRRTVPHRPPVQLSRGKTADGGS